MIVGVPQLLAGSRFEVMWNLFGIGKERKLFGEGFHNRPLIEPF
ncbi:hypothetical protein DSM14862_03529 (plasmid) [Sulfitobacter indolifex]|nr:hypothetical protein [Sulfitobacter indolifex]UOA20691.1 hypothetical protein DSM14862_03529 [Sulfitobacter indolifex]